MNEFLSLKELGDAFLHDRYVWLQIKGDNRLYHVRIDSMRKASHRMVNVYFETPTREKPSLLTIGYGVLWRCWREQPSSLSFAFKEWP